MLLACGSDQLLLLHFCFKMLFVMPMDLVQPDLSYSISDSRLKTFFIWSVGPKRIVNPHLTAL